MKLYLAASLIGLGAATFIAAHPPTADATSVALAMAGAAPAVMARPADDHWLFRAMPAPCDVQTLTTLPDQALANARPL